MASFPVGFVDTAYATAKNFVVSFTLHAIFSSVNPFLAGEIAAVSTVINIVAEGVFSKIGKKLTSLKVENISRIISEEDLPESMREEIRNEPVYEIDSNGYAVLSDAEPASCIVVLTEEEGYLEKILEKIDILVRITAKIATFVLMNTAFSYLNTAYRIQAIASLLLSTGISTLFASAYDSIPLLGSV